MKNSPYYFTSVANEIRTAADEPPIPPPMEAEYPAGWWVIYAAAIVLSILASAIWPYWVTP